VKALGEGARLPKGSKGWVLVTGGAGYVAGATVRALLARGYEVTVLDDLSTGHAHTVPPEASLAVGQVGERRLVEELVLRRGLVAILHFAGRAQVAESVAQPLAYYQANVAQSLVLFSAWVRLAPRVPLLLSSSAAVYGVPQTVPIPEDAPVRPVSPYGETKGILEGILASLEKAHGVSWAALRYFNAAGACPGVVEAHRPETHLIPNILAAARGEAAVTLYGTDYPTPDGTAVRDYVHVADLAEGHLLAMEYLRDGGASGPFNLGSGEGASVRQVLETAQRVVGRPIPHRFAARRPGDPPVLLADIGRAQRVLGFRPRRSTLEQVVADAWRWAGG
jgi:UDP-glucose 4-epimerase